MFKNGDFVFFKKARRSSNPRQPEGAFKGHGFGILLGHVPPFAPDPPGEHLLRLMGSVGFLSFDDVGEFFGREMGVECVKKFEEKYYPNQQPETKLMDQNGNPIGKV